MLFFPRRERLCYAALITVPSELIRGDVEDIFQRKCTSLIAVLANDQSSRQVHRPNFNCFRLPLLEK